MELHFANKSMSLKMGNNHIFKCVEFCKKDAYKCFVVL